MGIVRTAASQGGAPTTWLVKSPKTVFCLFVFSLGIPTAFLPEDVGNKPGSGLEWGGRETVAGTGHNCGCSVVTLREEVVGIH